MRAERPELGGLGERIADREALRHLGGDLRRIFVLRCRYQHARERGARLARVEVAAVDGAFHCRGQIGVVQDHRRALASELERDALHALGGELGDALAGARGAGEGNHVDLRVLHQRFAHRGSIAAHEVEDTGRQAGRFDHLGEDECVEGRDLRGFEHDRAAGAERRR